MMVDSATAQPAELRSRDAGEQLLRVVKLEASFRTGSEVVHAVRGVSLDVGRGERLGLVGESGCGKSALALSIAGLLEPPGHVDAGQIWLNGREIGQLAERQRRRTRGKEIALIFQDALSGLDPVKMVGRQIVECLRVHQPGLGRAAGRRRAVELLAEVGITGAGQRVNDYPHQFSGGMRQRVMVAMAIANDPDLLIADEPTTALDVTTQAQILRLLERMVSQHQCAVIFITHDLGVVAGFCESICVMYAGRIVESSTVERVFADPVHPYTEALLRSVPRPSGTATKRLPEIGGAPPNLSEIAAGCSFEPRCFLGHGRTRCLQETPIPVPLNGSQPRYFAECHYTPERLSRKGRAQ
jgi:oligopeptide/dipeptide ABC transporter ATP-binding protein